MKDPYLDRAEKISGYMEKVENFPDWKKGLDKKIRKRTSVLRKRLDMLAEKKLSPKSPLSLKAEARKLADQALGFGGTHSSYPPAAYFAVDAARIYASMGEFTPNRKDRFLKIVESTPHYFRRKNVVSILKDTASPLGKMHEERYKNPGNSSTLDNLARRWFGIICLLIGLFFLSPNLTGNAIGNLATSTSNWVGGILFISGLIGIYFFKKN
jgi:hypothetical protein